MEFTLFLTAEEINIFTDSKTPARQVDLLRGKGWRFELNDNRRPIVARKYVENVLGCGVPEQAVYRPNFAALVHSGPT